MRATNRPNTSARLGNRVSLSRTPGTDRFRDSLHLVLAFLFVYVAASDYHPFWMLDPAPKGPTELENKAPTQALRKASPFLAMDQFAKVLTAKLSWHVPISKHLLLHAPGEEHLHPELKYSSPIDKVRLRPRAHAPPLEIRST